MRYRPRLKYCTIPLAIALVAAGCDYFRPQTKTSTRASRDATAESDAVAAQVTNETLAAELAREREARKRAEDALAQERATPETSRPQAARAREPRRVAQARGDDAPSASGRTGPEGTPRVTADLHLNQGLTYAAMKDWDNAIAEFTKAITLDGRYAPAYANRAVAYMQQRKYNKAFDDLQRAESLKPRDKMVHYNYVALYSLQNQLDRSLDSLDRALTLGFDNYEALRTDPDLNNVRQHPEFQRVLEKHKVFIR